MRICLLPFAFLLALTPAVATPADLLSVAALKPRQRVLLVFAPTMRDPKLEAERQVMARFAADAATRDLVFVQVAEGKVIGAKDDAGKLRRRFQTPTPRFRALLIGKDGHVSVDSADPLDEARLKGTIDAMPMRQEEVRRAKAGQGKLEP